MGSFSLFEPKCSCLSICAIGHLEMSICACFYFLFILVSAIGDTFVKKGGVWFGLVPFTV